MARQLRIAFPGALYHVTARGNARQRIFSDNHDRERFLIRLAESVETYGVRLYLFCLMTNHVHLVLETPAANLSRFMQSVETGYTQYFNIRHETVGHLFQGRYKARLVDGNDYLLKLSRYVHLNPVSSDTSEELTLTQKIARLRRYRWSSYLGYIGLDAESDFVAYGPVLALLGDVAKPRERYRKFVEAGLANDDVTFRKILSESSDAIGDEAFRARIRSICVEAAACVARPEDVAFRTISPRSSVQLIVEACGRHLGVGHAAFKVKRRNSLLRPVAALMLSQYAAATHREIADVLGMKSGVSASLQVRKAAALKKTDHAVARLIARIEQEIVSVAAAESQPTAINCQPLV